MVLRYARLVTTESLAERNLLNSRMKISRVHRLAAAIVRFMAALFECARALTDFDHC